MRTCENTDCNKEVPPPDSKNKRARRFCGTPCYLGWMRKNNSVSCMIPGYKLRGR